MKTFLFLSFLIYCSSILSQSSHIDKSTDALAICLFDLEGLSSFPSSQNAEKAMQLITDVTGIAPRFALYQCNETNNCLAITVRGIRYIFYDSDFMNIIAEKTGAWSNISILAHEVGHHVNGHTIDKFAYMTGQIPSISLAQMRQEELEADEFSGFVMYKLGASLYQAQGFIYSFGFEGDDTNETHPNRAKRLAAIAKGYQKAKTEQDKYKTKTLTAEDYFYRALYAPREQYQYRLDNYNLAIQKNPNYTWAYNNRGNLKKDMGNLPGALQDFNKAISLESIDECYYNRGNTYLAMGKKIEAMQDYNKTLDINPKHAKALVNRGTLWKGVKDYDQAISNYRQAIKIHPTFNAYNSLGNAYGGKKDTKNAILAYSKAIEIGTVSEKLLANAFYFRGAAKYELGIYWCDDAKKACELNLKDACEVYRNKCN